MSCKRDFIILTGATGRLGKFFAEQLVNEGYSLILCSRSESRLKALHLDIGAETTQYVVADLADEQGRQRLIEHLEATGIRPLGLVNNARDGGNYKLDKGVPSPAQWHREFDLAVVTPFELARLLCEQSESRLRSIVNISSMYGVVACNPMLYEGTGRDSYIHYGVSKAAMIHLTKEMAVRFAPKGVRVNCLSLGGVQGRSEGRFLENYQKLCPSGRMLTEEECFSSLLFLLKEDSCGMTGHNMIVDGGWALC